MHSIKHKIDEQFQPPFATFPLGNQLDVHMPVEVESHIRGFDAVIKCISGLFAMFFLVFY